MDKRHLASRVSFLVYISDKSFLTPFYLLYQLPALCAVLLQKNIFCIHLTDFKHFIDILNPHILTFMLLVQRKGKLEWISIHFSEEEEKS